MPVKTFVKQKRVLERSYDLTPMNHMGKIILRVFSSEQFLNQEKNNVKGQSSRILRTHRNDNLRLKVLLNFNLHTKKFTPSSPLRKKKLIRLVIICSKEFS